MAGAGAGAAVSQSVTKVHPSIWSCSWGTDNARLMISLGHRRMRVTGRSLSLLAHYPWDLADHGRLGHDCADGHTVFYGHKADDKYLWTQNQQLQPWTQLKMVLDKMTQWSTTLCQKHDPCRPSEGVSDQWPL